MPDSSLLWQKYRAVFAYTGLSVAVSGTALLAPASVLLGWPDEWPQAIGFAAFGIPATLGGVVVYRRLRPSETILTIQDGGIFVLLSWAMACLLGSFPLMYVGRLTFSQAMFESVSGWTTTGLSVVDVTAASKTVLLFRSTMQLIGGAGFAVIMVAMLIGPGGTGVSGAEGRGEQLVPHVRRSAKLVLVLYVLYTIGTCAAYVAFGMGLFDAVNHAFAAVSTGGFSTEPESIGHWDSPALEAVSILGMLLGQTSFVTAYLVLTGNPKAALRDGEVRYTLLAWPLSAALLLAGVTGALYPTLGKSIRVAVFEAVTALTTTGFSTVGYANWNALGIVLLILLMAVGGGSYSTAGGIKQYRVVLLAKAVVWEIRRNLLPAGTVQENYVWHAGRKSYIRDEHLRQVGVFAFLYLGVFAVGTCIIAANGCSFRDSAFEFASALGTVGLSLGVTTADAPALVLWVEIVGMFLGRLEFFVVFVALARLGRDLMRFDARRLPQQRSRKPKVDLAAEGSPERRQGRPQALSYFFRFLQSVDTSMPRTSAASSCVAVRAST